MPNETNVLVGCATESGSKFTPISHKYVEKYTIIAYENAASKN